MSKLKVQEFTFIRYNVEVNIPGYDDERSEQQARIIAASMREGVQKHFPDATVDIEETTE